MRVRVQVALAAAVVLSAPASASAEFPHTVATGESLSSIAAADGLSVEQLAAANGLSAEAPLAAGSTLTIPAQSTGAPEPGAPSGEGGPETSPESASGDGDGDGDELASSEATGVPVATTTAPSQGSYVVQPGDTLSAIASSAGTSVAALAAENGLDPSAPLLAGAVLRVPGSSAEASFGAPSQPESAPEGGSGGPPYPTAETVSPSEVASIAAENGVPPSLATAIAQQESGFNNNLISSANARGVMQILPETWSWINENLASSGSPLEPNSATSNVRGGVLLLHSLLESTGNNPALAAAGYYQGLPSVREEGQLPETQQYVESVLALQQQYGGE
jgi:LysM repeat protein